MRLVLWMRTAHLEMGFIISREFISWRAPRPNLIQRAGAADHDHGAAVLVGVGDGGDAVGDAGAGGDEADAGAAVGSRPALGGVAGDLLVPDVDDADAVVVAAGVDVLDVAAAEGEDDVDALPA